MKIKNFIIKHKYVISFGVLIICFSLFMSVLFRKESDYFWHIKAGEYMFNSKEVLTNDIFSWFMSGSYWMSHEWAFDVSIFLLSKVFGKMHLFVYVFVCILLLLGILFWTNKNKVLKNISFSLLWIICFLLFCVYIQARPHLFSFSFLALTIYFTYDLFNNPESKKIYLLPIVTLFWTNFHGGSSNLSYLFCFIFVIIGLFEFKFEKIEAKRIKNVQIKRYLVVALMCMVAICINPHGIKMLWYPYSNMLDTVMINFISEWQPTTLGNFNHYPYFIFIIIIVFIFLFSKKKIEFIDLALFGIAVVLGLKSIRFWGYTYIIMSYVIFNYIKARKPDKGSCMVLLILSCLFVGLFIAGIPMVKKEYNKTMLSSTLINKVKELKPERLYNMYDYGGELVYNDISVFVDGRADLYSRSNLVDYKDISLLNKDYIKLIDKYNFDYFLVSKEYPIATYLKYDDNYEKVYSEDEIVLYKKRFD